MHQETGWDRICPELTSSKQADPGFSLNNCLRIRSLTVFHSKLGDFINLASLLLFKENVSAASSEAAFQWTRRELYWSQTFPRFSVDRGSVLWVYRGDVSADFHTFPAPLSSVTHRVIPAPQLCGSEVFVDVRAAVELATPLPGWNSTLRNRHLCVRKNQAGHLEPEVPPWDDPNTNVMGKMIGLLLCV